MAHSYARHLVAYAVPVLAVLLSYVWFKRKRAGKSSDPGEHSAAPATSSSEVADAGAPSLAAATPPRCAPGGTGDTPSASPRLPRVLSTPSTPIDIILPRELRSQRTSPVVISDEDLDLEIERIKSMRSCSAEKHARALELASSQESTPAGSSGAVAAPTPTQPPKKSSAARMSPVKAKARQLKMGEEGKPEEAHRASCERDSANHSPADVMLASPSLSCISDNRSEESSDSGKGGSDVAASPSRTPAGEPTLPLVYEFAIQQVLVGKLIGRYGAFVTEIKDKTGAQVHVKRHGTASKLKVCAVEGTQAEIDGALKMIRERFPLKRFPDVTLEPLVMDAPMASAPITSDHVYLKLVECVNNDTIVSCMVTPGHLFLQQPTHPSYPHLQILSRFMSNAYSDPTSPTLPTPILENTICVAKSLGEWYRAMVLSTDEESVASYVIFLDYGGYAVVPNAELRQIRNDFLLLPFQAAECMLANVKPAGDEEDALWCPEAFALVADLTKGALALTQIADYTPLGMPLVFMFVIRSPQEVVSLNDELVKLGYADYIVQPQEVGPYAFADEVEGAVGGVVA